MLKVTENQEVNFSEEMLAQFGEIVSHYPEGREKSALLPIMHLVQKEYGWMSVNAMDKIAEYLNLQSIEVYEVATFYTMFHLSPKGKYVLDICRTGPCCLVGAEKIMEHIEKNFGCKRGGSHRRWSVLLARSRMHCCLWFRSCFANRPGIYFL